MNGMYVFLDAEFLPGAGVGPPVLLSLGICAMNNAEFYRELATVSGIQGDVVAI